MHLPLSPTFLAVTLLAAALPAQQPPPASPTTRALEAAIDSRIAIGWHQGRRMGSGRNYKAEFTAEGFTFTPAFGRGAPHNFPVRWQTAEVRRGETTWPMPAVAPLLVEQRYEYHRGAVVERCHVLTDALAQDFTFSSLPPGNGDLVVRGNIGTMLSISQAGDDALQLRAPGIASFTLDTVTGIDARGERCRGSLRQVDGGRAIEFVLPAAFVASAALPLVLDPTWGAQITIETSTAADRHPRVATNSAGFTFHLVVWEHVSSATDLDIYGQYIDFNWALRGQKMFLAATAANEHDVTVASGPNEQFVFAYQQGTAVVARHIQNGVLGPLFTVAAAGSSPDLGAHLATANYRVACVWQAGQSIQHSILAVNSGVLSLASGPHVLLTGSATSPYTHPAISRTSGIGCDGACSPSIAEQQSRWAIVAQRDWSTDSDLHLRVIDINGLVVGGYAIDTSLEDHDFAAIDGNGRDWLVAWQRRVGSERDVVARQFTLPIGSTTVSAPSATPTVISGAAGLIEVLPSVTCLGTSCMIGYFKEVTVGQFQPRMTSRSLIGCEVCAGDAPLPGALTTAFATSPPRASSRRHLTSSDNTALVVCEFANPAHANNGQILGFQTDFLDGRVTRNAGNCGTQSGTLSTNCAVALPGALRVHLRDAQPNANAWLVLSPSTLGLYCGSCRLLPDPFAGVIVAATTDAIGAATVTLPPVGAGALWSRQLHAQWLIANPTNPGCSTLGVDLSSAKTILPQ